MLHIISLNLHIVSGPFTKDKETKNIKIYKKTWDSRYIRLNKVDKPYYQYDMAYGDFRTFRRRTASDEVFSEKGDRIANNPYDAYQRGLAPMVDMFFNNKSASVAKITAKTATVAGKGIALSETNQQIANELQKISKM